MAGRSAQSRKSRYRHYRALAYESFLVVQAYAISSRFLIQDFHVCIINPNHMYYK